ncbi:MAG: hypothetical protein KF812_02225 [Fimbriimonadaceae bacterium]|nr:hypothetical protein [Fimbriimonadaceae bacterium]
MSASPRLRRQLRGARDGWGSHPAELEGVPYADWMSHDFAALRQWEEELAPDLDD